MAPGCIPSQAAAAAVTEEVSFTAVPAKSPKPSFPRPSRPPRVGNRRAAATLNRKMTEMAWATSLSCALMTGAVAAMAKPPQMDEPTPMSVEISEGMRSTLCSKKRCDERGGDGGADDGQRHHAHLGDLREVQPEAQQHDGSLQHLLAAERDAGLHAAARGLLPEHGDSHAGQDGEHGRADDGEPLSDEPARQCEGEAYGQAGYVLQGVGHGRSFCYRTGARSVCVSDGVRVYHCRVAVAVIELATILKIYEHMFVNL